MATLRGFAPAKVNLTLHVTGKRDDGYHLLDSLVAFAGVGDQVEVSLAQDISLTVEGPFKSGIPTDDSNIIVKAAMALQHARSGDQGSGARTPLGAAIKLTKALPHPAGIGGGSSDAATTLKLLAELWQVAPLSPKHPFALALGADVPVCLAGPAPMRMAGIGDLLAPAPSLPNCAMVLVNAGQPASTADVFATLHNPNNDTMPAIPSGLDFPSLCTWLARQRNDLLYPARALTSGIDAALDRLRAMPQVKHSFMSGSGATCVGLVQDMTQAKQVARAIQVSEMNWWVAPASMLTS